MRVGPLTKTWRGKNRLERFLEKVERKPSGCWEWTAALDSAGYGLAASGYRNEQGHNLPARAYRILIGPARGLHCHHRCGNPLCVRPDHIQLLTRSEHGKFHGELVKCTHPQERRSHDGSCRECDRLRTQRRREDPAYRAKEAEQHRSWRRRHRTV